MSIVHRKLKPVDQNVGDQALHVYRTPETENSRSECRRPGTSVYCTLETEISRSEEETRHFMSIVHRKLKPVDQNVGDQALQSIVHWKLKPVVQKRRPGTSCLSYTGN